VNFIGLPPEAWEEMAGEYRLDPLWVYPLDDHVLQDCRTWASVSNATSAPARESASTRMRKEDSERSGDAAQQQRGHNAERKTEQLRAH
jgi:hypothetical protein